MKVNTQKTEEESDRRGGRGSVSPRTEIDGAEKNILGRQNCMCKGTEMVKYILRTHRKTI